MPVVCFVRIRTVAREKAPMHPYDALTPTLTLPPLDGPSQSPPVTNTPSSLVSTQFTRSSPFRCAASCVRPPCDQPNRYSQRAKTSTRRNFLSVRG